MGELANEWCENPREYNYSSIQETFTDVGIQKQATEQEKVIEQTQGPRPYLQKSTPVFLSLTVVS